MVAEFEKRVWEKLKKIPKGKITTYKQIAIALGRPRGARAVGNACRKNPNLNKFKCFRVVKSNGNVGAYVKGRREKIKLLKKEGIKIENGKILDFKQKLFIKF